VELTDLVNERLNYIIIVVAVIIVKLDKPSFFIGNRIINWGK